MSDLITSVESVECNPTNLVPESAGATFLPTDGSANELQSEVTPASGSRGILNPAPEVAKQPGPRFLTVEDFLRREAEKMRGQGVEDSENNASLALNSIGTSSPMPKRNERSKQRAQRAAQNGPQWKIQFKEEDVDESHEADPAEIDDAKEKALSLLNRRHISAAELRNKLTQNGFPANVVKVVTDRMQEIGLQNDLEYAEAFARVRWQSFRWGPDRVRRELKAKGISTDNLDEAIRAIYGDRADILRVSPESGSEVEELAGQHDEEDVSGNVERELYVAAKRHFLSGDGSDVNRRWKRTADWLARRGFSWGTASSIMVALKAEADVWK
ncbi:regulatory protein RecX family protein [Klebsormidium nitens]|uniref:Regulatory protein RecX n=1 Tax=Klebsormidium nitens TaxID=105231 RepID=A0A1Y1I7L3_KLENI|nr:regulatory protein RecX family protein [Klebsormidium nitens]|eukprot:GAQ85922.1 regulatory protein RecX family protein [Klebsormidium nitens]